MNRKFERIMSVSKEDVEKIAQLAKLRFSPEEKKELVKQLDQIIHYVKKLDELDTRDVLPATHATESKNVLREDVAEKWLSQQEALVNAPAKKKGFFSVPKVIK